jgi:hypothetical protein
MSWPEANVLIPRAVDPECGMPAYRDAFVEIQKVNVQGGARP